MFFMRVLSEDELDSVYGGQNVRTTGLGTVQVTATRLRQTSGVYWQGAGSTGFGSDEIGGGGSSCWSGVFTPIKAWEVPSVGKIRCMMDEAAVAGFNLSPNYPVAVVNSWAWGAPDETIPGKIQLKFTGNTNQPPGPEYTGYSGFSYTESQGDIVKNTVSLFPGGMIAGVVQTGMQANMPDGSIRPAGYNLGNLSVNEHSLLVVAHEAAHQQVNLRGLSLSHEQVEGLAQQALINFQSRKNQIESNCLWR
jgi:hypothetical protein